MLPYLYSTPAVYKHYSGHILTGILLWLHTVYNAVIYLSTSIRIHYVMYIYQPLNQIILGDTWMNNNAIPLLPLLIISILLSPLSTNMAQASGQTLSIKAYNIYGSTSSEYAVEEMENIIVAGSTPVVIYPDENYSLVLKDSSVKVLSAIRGEDKIFILGLKNGGALVLSVDKNGFGDAIYIQDYEPSDIAYGEGILGVTGYDKNYNSVSIIKLDMKLRILSETIIGLTDKLLDYKLTYNKYTGKFYIVALLENSTINIIDEEGNGVKIQLPMTHSYKSLLLATVLDKLIISVSSTNSIVVIDYSFKKEYAEAKILNLQRQIINTTHIWVNETTMYLVGMVNNNGSFIIDYNPPGKAAFYILRNIRARKIKAEDKFIKLLGSALSSKVILAISSNLYVDNLQVNYSKIRGMINVVKRSYTNYNIRYDKENIVWGKVIDKKDPCIIFINRVKQGRLIIELREYGLKPLRYFTDKAWIMLDNAIYINISMSNSSASIIGLAPGRHLLEAYYVDRLGGKLLIYHGAIEYKGGVQILKLYRNTPYVLNHTINNSIVSLTLVNPSHTSWTGEIRIYTFSNHTLLFEREFETLPYPHRANIELHTIPYNGRVIVETYVAINGKEYLTHTYLFENTFIGGETTPTPLLPGGTTTTITMRRGEAPRGGNTTTTKPSGEGEYNFLLVIVVSTIIVIVSIVVYIMYRRRR